MGIGNKPVRTTIYFGLFCGLLFFLISMFFKYALFWPLVFKITIFSYLALYSLFLAKWGNKKSVLVLYPLFLLLILALCWSPLSSFLLLSLAILSWIRSGICFTNTFARSFCAELIFTAGGGAFVAYFNPHSTVSWALGIWMFFLIQSLYFILMHDPEHIDREKDDIDPFEMAGMRADRILNGI